MLDGVIATDVANTFGNVDVQIYKNNIISKEFNIHNSITKDGILQLLKALSSNTQCYLTGIRIYYRNKGTSETTYIDFDTFRIPPVIRDTTTNNPYLYIRFFIPSSSEEIIDMQYKEIHKLALLMNDSTGTLIEFAVVDSSSVIPGSGGGTDTQVFPSIDKTPENAIMITWKIGITSVFETA